MIKLTDLLKEVQNRPKAIIMAGGASVGKSTVLNTLKPVLKNFVDLNADKYVEDKDSSMYGNLSAASSQIRKVDLPNAISNKQNLIYNVPYSPEFNPIEKVFSQVKNYLKKVPYTNKTINRYITKAFNSIKSDDLEKFYKKSLNF
jgi:uridine kinase